MSGEGGGEGGENSPGEDTPEVTSCPQMVLTMQVGQRDIIPVKGRIPGR